MKSVVLLAAVMTFGVLVHAGEKPSQIFGSIACKSANPKEQNQITLTAKNFGMFPYASSDGGSRMDDVTVTVTDVYNSNQIQTGRVQSLAADSTYKARKYKNHYRFQLSKMIDTENFGAFWPGDQCDVQVMIPHEAFEKKTFLAPTLMHCDQSGGVQSLACEVIEEK